MYPEWVLKHKTAGTNISCINGRYYLYKVGSVWNKEKKRAQKITKEYLGRITENGLIAPKEKREKTKIPISVKESGASLIICELGKEILTKLKEVFPKEAEMLFTLSTIKTIEPTPLKRVERIYNNSFLSEVFKGLKLSGKDLSAFFKDFGNNREKIVEFMRYFMSGSEHIIFDGTSIISKSEKMNINRLGYNAQKQYDPQIGLLYAFACESKTPVYYRIMAGNVRDVSAFKLSIAESKLKDMIVVGDKGLSSQDNFDLLKDNNINYILPLRRNNALFDSRPLETGNKSAFDGYFLFNERPIWYYKTSEVIVYLDNDLKNEEEKDYLNRIEKNLEGYTKENFIEKQFKFGTIVIKSNVNKTPVEIYNIFKQRQDIEQSFDVLKNLMEQDKTYMQNEKSLETWSFINHISLMLNYKIYNLLREKNLLAKYSVADFLSHLKYIFKVKIDDLWLSTEISAKTRNLLLNLNLHIT